MKVQIPGSITVTVGGRISRGVRAAEVTEDGRLLFTMTDGSVIDLGSVKGPQGQTGEKGEKGEKGDVGARGEKGDTGEPGAYVTALEKTAQSGQTATYTITMSDGAAFAFEVESVKGEKGDKGDPGEQGIQGQPGEKGDKGDKGEPGATGATGAAGADGLTPSIGTNGNWYLGSTDTGKPARGEKGEKGEPGAQGSQGAKGDKGDKGDTGATGAKGDKGEKGDTGTGFKVLGYYASASSLQGAVMSPNVGDAYGVGVAEPFDIYIYDGVSGTWVNNGPLQGAKGDTGTKGDKGDKGEKGDTGANGQDGADGLTPTIGENGNWYLGSTDTGKPARGEKGEKGEPGETGATGAKGDKGDTGATGNKGDKGDAFTYADFTAEQLAALKGDKGDKGDPGEKGDKGEKGDTGATGAKGDKGEPGAAGQDGSDYVLTDEDKAEIAELAGTEPFTVNIGVAEDGYADGATFDMPFASIKEAYDAGRVIWANIDAPSRKMTNVPLLRCTEDDLTFGCTVLDAADTSGTLNTYYVSLDANDYSECYTGTLPFLTKYNTFKGASASAAGDVGSVPAPAAGEDGKFLKGNGTWSELPGASIGAKGVTYLVDSYERTDTDKAVTPKALNTVYKMFNRSTAVHAADANYTTLMVRGESLNAEETTPAVNGAIAWQYE